MASLSETFQGHASADILSNTHQLPTRGSIPAAAFPLHVDVVSGQGTTHQIDAVHIPNLRRDLPPRQLSNATPGLDTDALPNLNIPTRAQDVVPGIGLPKTGAQRRGLLRRSMSPVEDTWRRLRRSVTENEIVTYGETGLAGGDQKHQTAVWAARQKAITEVDPTFNGNTMLDQAASTLATRHPRLRTLVNFTRRR